jgi:hypothetical protein
MGGLFEAPKEVRAVLTKLKTYSSLQSPPTLLLTDPGKAETDLIQIRDINGLDPVVASVGTVPYGAADGEAYVGSSVLSRNIVLTIHPNPDWNVWSPEALRRLLYSYFMPKQVVRLVFQSDDVADVEIRGVVESFAANMFSKDPEYIASIICPDPYFISTSAFVFTGSSDYGDIPPSFEYNGNVPAGIQVKVERDSGTAPSEITISMGDPDLSFFKVTAPAIVSTTKYFRMSSFPMSKYVESVNIDTGKITSLLSNVATSEGAEWPFIQPGVNQFIVSVNTGVVSWELTYFERFGGL